MKARHYIGLLFVTAILAGCFRLDDNLFNGDTSITEYLLDDYQGEVTFRLDPSYAIADSMVRLFTLQSQAPGEIHPPRYGPFTSGTKTA